MARSGHFVIFFENNLQVRCQCQELASYHISVASNYSRPQRRALAKIIGGFGNPELHWERAQTEQGIGALLSTPDSPDYLPDTLKRTGQASQINSGKLIVTR